MTVPDGDLGDVLRRQLSAAADAVEPAADGLERIRARTGKRPPQPWLVSVLSGAVTRARYWVWHGHWAWSPPRLSSLSSPRSWVRSLPQSWRGSWSRGKAAPGTAWLRPVAVLAGVAFMATIALTVPPLRQAIVQVSNNITGSQTSGGAGTDGNGSPTGNGGGGTLSTGARSTAGAGPSGSQNGSSRGPAVTSSCKPTASATATAGGSALPLSKVESALPGTQPASCPSASSTSLPVTVPSQVATSVPTSVVTSTPTPTTVSTPTSTGTPTATTTPTTSPSATDTGTATPSTSASGAGTGSVGS